MHTALWFGVFELLYTLLITNDYYSTYTQYLLNPEAVKYDEDTGKYNIPIRQLDNKIITLVMDIQTLNKIYYLGYFWHAPGYGLRVYNHYRIIFNSIWQGAILSTITVLGIKAMVYIFQ